jgi:hypothetical protein
VAQVPDWPAKAGRAVITRAAPATLLLSKIVTEAGQVE